MYLLFGGDLQCDARRVRRCEEDMELKLNERMLCDEVVNIMETKGKSQRCRVEGFIHSPRGILRARIFCPRPEKMRMISKETLNQEDREPGIRVCGRV